MEKVTGTMEEKVTKEVEITLAVKAEEEKVGAEKESMGANPTTKGIKELQEVHGP